MADPLSIEQQRKIEQQLAAIMQAVSNSSLKIIADRMKEVGLGNYSYTTVYKNFVKDNQKYESMVKSARDAVNAIIANQYTQAALSNDEWAAKYYEEMGVKQLSSSDSKVLGALLESKSKDAQDFVRKNLNTKAMGIVGKNGKYLTWGSYYRQSVSNAVTSMLAGEESYQTAIQQSVREMAESGLRVGVEVEKVAYPKTTRELYSSVRMNVMGNYRQMLQQMRNVQGDEYGADGWEVTAHALCAPDHLPYQGNVYTDKEFQSIQKGLPRPLVDGANCHHQAYRVKYDIAIKYPAISEEELDEINGRSTEEVTITGLSGEQRSMSRYDATQYQRRLETELRKTKTEQALSNDSKQFNQRIKDLQKCYNGVCKDAGLPKYPENTKAYFLK